MLIERRLRGALAWSLEQDGQLCQLAQWLAARQGVAPRELRAGDFDAAMANQGGRFGTLRAQSTAAMPARCGALLALNTAVTERLLPWVDLRAVATPGSLAAMVCAIKACLLTKEKWRFWDGSLYPNPHPNPYPN